MTARSMIPDLSTGARARGQVDVPAADAERKPETSRVTHVAGLFCYLSPRPVNVAPHAS